MRETYLDLQCPQSHPTGNESTRVVRGTTQRHQSRTILGVRNLRDQQRSTAEHKTVSESDQQTGCNKHAKAGGSRLEAHRKKHNQAADETSQPTAVGIDQIRHHEETDQRAQTHGRVEETQKGPCGIVEVLLPVGERLQTVHHGAVEPVGRVGHDEDNDVNVQGAHVLSLPPRHSLEFLVRKEEVALGRLDGHDLLGLLGWPESQPHDCDV